MMKQKVFGIILVVMAIVAWGFDAHYIYLWCQTRGEEVRLFPVVTFAAFVPFWFGMRLLRRHEVKVRKSNGEGEV